MSNNEITETDVSNFLLAVVLLIVCLIPLSAIVFFDLENNSAALALSTFLLLMALLWVKKKYRKPVENQSAQKRKGYPFEVAIDNDRQSAALADQVKSLDWRARGAKRKGRVSEEELSEIRAKARALIGK